MGTSWLLVKEIWQRRWRFLIALVGIVLPVTVFVASTIVMVYSQDEVRKLGLDMGLNIFVVPRELDLDDYYTAEFGDAIMPEEYVGRIFGELFDPRSPTIIARHFTGMLHGRIEVGGHKAILTGVMPEKDLKPKPGTELEADEAHLGSVIAELLELRKGDTLEVGGEKLRVTKVLEEEGVHEDIRITTNLHTAQRILGREEGINTIEALSCVCKLKPPEIVEEIEKRLPGTRAILRSKIARVRTKARRHIQLVATVLITLTLVVGGAAVASQSLAEVAERRREIGMFLAIGAGPWRIARLFLYKFVLLGVLGGLLGYVVGYLVAMRVGPGLFGVWKPFKAAFGFVGVLLAVGAVGLAVGMSLVIGSISTFKASRLDPAAILREA